ncbi:hypothetical protein U1Q18_036971 [Sarracenia purpurea var. burkii]
MMLKFVAELLSPVDFELLFWCFRVAFSAKKMPKKVHLLLVWCGLFPSQWGNERDADQGKRVVRLVALGVFD